MQIARASSRAALAGALLALSAATPAPAGPASAPQDGDGRPRVVLESATGELRRRPLEGFETADPREQGAVLVRFEGLERPALPARSRDRGVLSLADGGRVHGLLRGGSGEELSLELLSGAVLHVPIERMQSLVFPGRVPVEWTEPLQAPELGDRLYLYRSGGLDRVDGAVEAFAPEGVRFDSSLGSKEFAWDEITALFIELLDEGGGAPTDGGTPVSVDLIDGSRLRGELMKLDARECNLRTPGGRGLRLPLEVVSEVLVLTDRLTFLSDLPPDAAEESSPFGDDLGMSWPHQRDRSVSGGPLRAGGTIWSRGLGVHAPSRLTWRLGGAWRSLRGMAAVDDEVLTLAARGSVRFRVLADGEQRWESQIVRGGDAPVELPAIDLEGVDELVLEVDPATDLHVADRADWLHLVLRK
jgi:hypothetical protein